MTMNYEEIDFPNEPGWWFLRVLYHGVFMEPMPVHIVANVDGYYMVDLFVDEDHMERLASSFKGAKWAKIPEPI